MSRRTFTFVTDIPTGHYDWLLLYDNNKIGVLYDCIIKSSSQ